jgi:hypothetical protein
MYSVGDKVRVKTGVHGGAFTGWIGEVAKIYDDGYALPIEVELTRNTEKSFISFEDLLDKIVNVVYDWEPVDRNWDSGISAYAYQDDTFPT